MCCEVRLRVAETREKRSVLATEIIKGVMLPQFVILPLAVLLVWLALVRGIKPLSQLEERIRARKPDDLSPLDDTTVPLEVAPLVSSVNQLLALARAESSGRALPRHPCNLAQLTMEAVRDSLPRAMDKHIDLGYVGASPEAAGVTLSGNATLLKEMILNLLDNAIGYTPSSAAQPGVITARVLADPFGHVLVLQVEDTGPGIPESERELVFQPFYRALGTNVGGSGLGLPIVREIARQHDAEIRLEDARPGDATPGTRVSIRFVVDEAAVLAFAAAASAPAYGANAALPAPAAA